jgi:S1-C subfamily serine protease
MPDRIASASLTSLPAASQTSSVFKVLRTMGHGSAVHIGNGYVLTAAHVVAPRDPSLLGAFGAPDAANDIVLKTLDGEALDVAFNSTAETTRT